MTCTTCKHEPIWQGPDSKGRRWGHCRWPVDTITLPGSWRIITIPVEVFPDGFGLPDKCLCYEAKAADICAEILRTAEAERLAAADDEAGKGVQYDD